MDESRQSPEFGAVGSIAVTILERLLQIGATTQHQAAQQAAGIIAVALQARVVVFLYDTSREALFSPGEHEANEVMIRDGGSLVQVLQTGQPTILRPSDDAFNPARFGDSDAYAVPLEGRGRRSGVMVASRSDTTPFSALELESLERIGSWIGTVLYRTNLVTRALADAADQATHHDVLTGLPTRPLFVQDVRQALQRSTGHRTAIAVLLLNMDRMKHLNESWGHEVGNEILIRTARRIRSSLRPGDTVARLEGDDFVVLLEENKDTSFPCRLAERILGVVDAPLDIAGQRVFVSASLGIAFGTDPHDSPEDIISNAELAVRRAKVEGRGQYAVFDPALDGLHQRRVTSVNQA